MSSPQQLQNSGDFRTAVQSFLVSMRDAVSGGNLIQAQQTNKDARVFDDLLSLIKQEADDLDKANSESDSESSQSNQNNDDDRKAVLARSASVSSALSGEGNSLVNLLDRMRMDAQEVKDSAADTKTASDMDAAIAALDASEKALAQTASLNKNSDMAKTSVSATDEESTKDAQTSEIVVRAADPLTDLENCSRAALLLLQNVDGQNPDKTTSVETGVEAISAVDKSASAKIANNIAVAGSIGAAKEISAAANEAASLSNSNAKAAALENDKTKANVDAQTASSKAMDEAVAMMDKADAGETLDANMLAEVQKQISKETTAETTSKAGQQIKLSDNIKADDISAARAVANMSAESKIQDVSQAKQNAANEALTLALDAKNIDSQAQATQKTPLALLDVSAADVQSQSAASGQAVSLAAAAVEAKSTSPAKNKNTETAKAKKEDTGNDFAVSALSKKTETQSAVAVEDASSKKEADSNDAGANAFGALGMQQTLKDDAAQRAATPNALKASDTTVVDQDENGALVQKQAAADAASSLMSDVDASKVATVDKAVIAKPLAAVEGASENTQNNNAIGVFGAQKTIMANGAENAAAATTPARQTNLTQVVQQVASMMKQTVKNGDSELSIQLHPSELGRVDVKLIIKEDNQVTGVITADNQSTLDLLKRDSSQLQQSLQDAGLQANANSLQFNLRSDDQQQQFANMANTQQNRDVKDNQVKEAVELPRNAEAVAEHYYATSDGVNLKV